MLKVKSGCPEGQTRISIFFFFSSLPFSLQPHNIILMGYFEMTGWP